MPRPKKENHPMTIRLATHLYERLNDFCEDSGQSKTIAIERALEMYIDDYDRKQQILISVAEEGKKGRDE